MKSYLFSPRSIISKIEKITNIFDGDRISVYAAQASFFIIISAIPFIMLLVSLIQYVIPVDIIDIILDIQSFLPESFEGFVGDIIDELFSRQAIALVSVTAITTLWSASKGVRAVERGVKSVYKVEETGNFFTGIMRSFFYTIAFILILIVSLIVLVFGREISYILSEKYAAVSALLDILMRCRIIIFLVILTLFFSLLYNALARSAITAKNISMRYRDQIPGAFTASLAWLLYSFFYSLYLKYFPSASYIYGSLAAVVLLMLWLYFCMMILLIGAEINKYLLSKKTK